MTGRASTLATATSRVSVPHSPCADEILGSTLEVSEGVLLVEHALLAVVVAPLFVPFLPVLASAPAPRVAQSRDQTRHT